MHQATTWPPACARAFAQGFPLRQRLREDKPACAVKLRPAGNHETLTKVHFRFVFRSIVPAVSRRRLNEIWPSYFWLVPKIIMWREKIDEMVSRLPTRYQRSGKQFVKFGITGVIGAVVDFGTYNILTRGIGFITSYTILGQQIIVANNISVFLAIMSNFMFNKYWTFRDTSKQVAKQWVGYFTLNFFTWMLNQLLVSIFAFQVPIVQAVFGTQKDNAAKVLAIGIILFINFAGSKFLIFKKPSRVLSEVEV